MRLSNAKSRASAPTYEPAAYLAGCDGWFTIGQEYPGETCKWRQESYLVADLDSTLDLFYADPTRLGFRPDCDSYISQNPSKKKGSRTAADTSVIRCMWMDLDLKKAGIDIESNIPAIEARRIELGLPPFSIVNSTGGGLHIKLIYADDVDPAQSSEWHEAISTLSYCFADFAPDYKVFDTSRVLRLPGTPNVKRGEYCRTIQETGEVHNFSDLCAILKPHTAAAKAAAIVRREQEAATRAKTKAEAAGLTWGQGEAVAPKRRLSLVESAGVRATIHRPALPAYKPALRLYSNPRVDWNGANYIRLALADIEALMGLRFAGGILPAEERDELIFPACMLLAAVHAGDYRAFRGACWEMSSRHCEWTESDLDNCISSLSRRFLRDCKGEEPPEGYRCWVYTPSVKTLIAFMKIAASEQIHLRVLVDDDGRQERDRQRKEQARREAGMTERTAYLQLAIGKRELALQLHSDGLSAADIARITGLPKRSIYRYLETVPSVSAYAVAPSLPQEAFEPLVSSTNALVPKGDTQQSLTGPVVVLGGVASALTEDRPRVDVQAAAVQPQAVEKAAPAVARMDWRTAELADGNDGWGGAWAEIEAALDGRPAPENGASNPQAALITPAVTVEDAAQMAELWAEMAFCLDDRQELRQAGRAPP